MGVLKEIKGNYTSRYIVFFLFGILFYLLNRFSPFINDDFYYAFIMEDLHSLEGGGRRPITSFGDVIDSNLWAYHNQNGRFLVHVVVQTLCGLVNIEIFRLLNSILFVFLLIGICKLIRKEYQTKSTDIFIVNIALYLLIPLMGVTFLGNISCAVNYLWVSCATVWFIILWQSFISNIRRTKIQVLGACIYALICGSLQESFSVGISAYLVLYFCFKYKTINSQVFNILVFYVIGSVIVVFAPANFMRLASEGASADIMSYVLRIIRVALSLRAFWVFVVLFIVYFSFIRNEAISFLKKNQFLCISAGVNIIFAAIIAFTGKHQLVSIELFCIVLLVKLLYSFCWKCLLPRYLWICVLAFILFMILYVPVYFYREKVYNAYEIAVNSSLKVKNHEIIAEEYENICVTNNWFIVNYCRRDTFYKFNRVGLSLYRSNGEDPNLILSVLPASKKEIKNICSEENEISEYVYRRSFDKFYVIKLSKSIELKDIVVESYIEPGIIGKYLYKMIDVKNRKVTKTYEKYDVSNCNQFDDDDNCYIIINPIDPISDLRVRFN